MATHSKFRYRIHPASWLIVLFSFLYNSFYSKAYTGFSLKENKKVSKIPFQLIDNLIVIDLKINESHTVKAVFDTGARSIILYGRKFKKQLDYTNTRIVNVSGLGKGKLQQGALAVNNSVEIGEVLGEGVGLVHMMCKIPFSKLSEANIEAVLGYQLFSNFIIEIDYGEMVISFHDPISFEKDEEAFDFDLDIIDTKPYITTKVTIDEDSEITSKWLIDTGASVDMIVYNTSYNYGYFINGKKKKNVIGFGFNGEIEGISTSKKIKLGGIQLGNKNVHIIDKYSDGKEGKQFGADGLVGANILKQYKVTFDYIGGHVYLKPVI